jgi:hypothetical protein
MSCRYLAEEKMPYSGENDRNLPVNVKKMAKKDRRQWVHIFNSVLSSSIEKGEKMEECEKLAYTEANGVLKKEGKSKSADS